MTDTSFETASEQFATWLRTQIGEVRWIVARRSKKRIKSGYELFLTKTRFDALQRHFDKEMGEMEADGISKHLTEPNPQLAQQRKDTFPGMAHWAGTGPDAKTCRSCARWKADGYLASSGLLKDAQCGKYAALMHGEAGNRVPHFAKACKYYEPGEERPIQKPREILSTVGAHVGSPREITDGNI